MTTDKKTRRQQATVEAIDPITGKKFAVLVNQKRLHEVSKRGRGHILEAAEFVPIILQEPKAIFEGLCCDNDEPRGRGYGWRCYSGIPPYAYNVEGIRISAWPDEVFLVFVNRDRIAYLWYWAKCDPENPFYPEEHEKRFKRKLL